MAYSSAARNVAKLGGAWLAVAALSASSIIYFDEIRSVLGLKLGPGDFGMVAPTSHQPQAESGITSRPRHADRTVELRAGSNGHFHTIAHINGRPVEVMVDTGASMVALTWEDAQRAGIFLRNSDFTQRVGTANGVARVAIVTLDTVAIDDITVRHVRAAVSEPGNLDTTLLGMSFLSQLGGTEMSRGVLLLKE
jgi:aspartyl protease family protein